MVREFKKVGAAAAVAGALLASGSSFANVQLSVPGDVVLVPYVICDPANNNQNTLVGLITFDKGRIGLRAGGIDYSAPWILATAEVDLPTPGTPSLPTRVTLPQAGAFNEAIHWYFYDVRSNHLLNGVIPVTDNDFVRFDWCATIRETGQDVLNGVNGYLIFTTDDVDRADNLALVESVPKTALYGHAYQIQGNWESQAFIPIVANPLHSYLNVNPTTGVPQPAGNPDRIANVVKRNGYPAFARLLSGSNFAARGTNAALRRDVYMRYFLDPALATENRMVFWFNNNSGTFGAAGLGYTPGNGYGLPAPVSLVQDRSAVAGETYDSEQVYRNSFSISFPNELNIVRSTPTAPAFPGMLHASVEAATGVEVVNTGIVRFGIPEAVLTRNTAGTERSTAPFASSGVSFNLLGLGAGGAAAQLQTEMATVGPA
jgi:hypothetical protein